MNTVLQDYTLWYDGDITVPAKDVAKYLALAPSNKVHVDNITSDIKQYNKFVDQADRITTKSDIRSFDLNWNLPQEYIDLDIESRVIKGLVKSKPDNISERMNRVMQELEVFHSQNLDNFLRCLIYVVDTFTENAIVWGVGRGSSVASYVLYLIGIHDIDSYLYNLPFSDFIKA